MKVKLKCPECSSEFQLENWDHKRRLRMGRTIIYCSKGCSSINSNKNRYEKRLLKCENCGKEEYLNETDDRKKYCSQECYKDHDKERLRELARRIGKESSEEISKTKKKQYASGEVVHPLFGKHHRQETIDKMKGRFISDISKERMSNAQTKRILLGLKPKYSKGNFFSEKNNEEFHYRSSWEKHFMEYLENNKDVKTYGYECLRIPYVYRKNKRWYIPDFKVGDRIIEIKPQFLINKKRNLSKFKAAREYCKANNMTFEVITEVELKTLGVL